MRHVLASNLREKDVANLQRDHVFNPCVPVMHIYCAIQNGEYFFAIVNVPTVWLVCPVQSRRRTRHVCNVFGTPRMDLFELLATENFHFVKPYG